MEIFLHIYSSPQNFYHVGVHIWKNLKKKIPTHDIKTTVISVAISQQMSNYSSYRIKVSAASL